MQEEWRPVRVRGVDFTGYYEVSNLGRIKKLPTTSLDGRCHLKERIMKPTLDKKGYLTVNLLKDGKRYTRVFVHRIVAEAFIPNPNNLPQVGHRDDLPLKTNNHVGNLYWTTNKENANTIGRKEDCQRHIWAFVITTRGRLYVKVWCIRFIFYWILNIWEFLFKVYFLT